MLRRRNTGRRVVPNRRTQRPDSRKEQLMTYPDTHQPERQYALDTLAAADDARAEEPADRRDERRPAAAEYDRMADGFHARAATLRSMAAVERDRGRERIANALESDARHLERIAASYEHAADEVAP